MMNGWLIMPVMTHEAETHDDTWGADNAHDDTRGFDTMTHGKLITRDDARG